MNTHTTIAASLSELLDKTAAPTRDPSPLDAVMQDAAKLLASFQNTRLKYSPISGDVESVCEDLETVAAIFDGVLSEMGRHYAEHFGFSPDKAADYFDGLCWSALEGNATFVVSAAYADYVEDRMGR